MLGDDGGAVCANPNNALSRATCLEPADERGGRAGHTGRSIADTPGSPSGRAAIIKVYCPDELAEFQKFVDDLKTADVAVVRDRGPARSASPS